VVIGALIFIAVTEAKKPRSRPLVLGVALSASFLPAHLIWKSYFVLGIPLMAALFHESMSDRRFFRKFFYPALFLGIGLSFSSIDFVGPRAAAWIEAYSPFFWVHLGMTITGYYRIFYQPSHSS
jgi:hypothetical protein